ncbi:MAG: hypothetical protein JRI39_13195 [Deltaproteobacteria bacterium]|nr:hypothetical protein [Deltaproteobacteria bacterium]
MKQEFTLAKLKKGQKGNEWLLIKKKDGLDDPNWKLQKALTPERSKELKVKQPPCATP